MSRLWLVFVGGWVVYVLLIQPPIWALAVGVGLIVIASLTDLLGRRA